MIEIIQGEKQPITIDLVSSVSGKRVDLTGNIEITVCYKAETTIVAKKKTLAEVVVVGDPADGQITAHLLPADTDTFPATQSGHIEVIVDYDNDDIRKSQILDAFRVTEKICP